MKLRKIAMQAAVGVIALGALAGAGARSASAASWTYLCATETGSTACAYSEGVGNFIAVDPSFSGMTNWTYPNTNGAVGTIKQANVNLCMQLDNAYANFVRGAACNGDAAEQWKNVYNPSTHRTWFVSEWLLENGGGTQCLTWYLANNSSGTPGGLDMGTCDNSGIDNWAS